MKRKGTISLLPPSDKRVRISPAQSPRSSQELALAPDHGTSATHLTDDDPMEIVTSPTQSAAPSLGPHGPEVPAYDPSVGAKGTTPQIIPAVEEKSPSFEQLRDAMERGDTNLYDPLLAALFDLNWICRSVEGLLVTERELVTLEARLRGFKIVDSLASTAVAGTSADQDLHRLLHDIGAVVLRIWDALPHGAQGGTTGQPTQTVKDSSEINSLLTQLLSILAIFEFDSLVVNRLDCVRQRLGSRLLMGVIDSHSLARNIGQNSNTALLFGNGSMRSSSWVSFTIHRAEEPALEKITASLKERHLPQAVFDAQPNSGCMKQTRVRILSETAAWIKDPDSLQICWITGMAGTGKTSIAKTVCEQASEDAEIILGGSFFCSRSSGLVAQRDIRCVIPTLTQLLARRSVDFCEILAETIHGGIQHQEVAAQVELLFRTPLSGLKESSVTILFVIDALDECGGMTTDGMFDDSQCQTIVASMLEALVRLTRSETKLPVKFLITSRPAAYIRKTSIANDKLSQVLRLHTVDVAEVNMDIKQYITENLNIRLSSRPEFWESITDSDIENLVQLCDGLFIVASTSLAYILNARASDTVARFWKLFNPAGDGLSYRAVAPLDRMYEITLNDAAREAEFEATELPVLPHLLASVISARMTLSVAALSDLLNLEPYMLHASLSRLHAVVHVPERDDIPGLRTLHASFGDYMFNRAPNNIRILPSLGHDALAHGCLNVMGKQLHYNISQSRSSYDSNPLALPEGITLSLEYACMQWTRHFAALVDIGHLEVKIGAIFRPRFLSWLEVMSLLRQVRRAARMLFTAAATVGAQPDSDLAQFLRDANSFVASSYEAIERSAPHIYLSALPFADKNSLVYQEFMLHFSGLINVTTFGIGHHGDDAVMTLAGHNNAVRSVSYSSDGRHLASGSEDGTVRVWDTRTGEEAMFPMRSGDGQVLSVKFAHNSKWIASGTESGALCIWNVTPGHAGRRKLSGHSGAVRSVAFSRDSSRIASASDDATLRLWDAETGEQLSVLVGHSDCVNGVAFSPDGNILASVSGDETMRLWNSSTGEDARELLKSVGSLHGVSFSPNGAVIAGVLDDGLVLWQLEIWDSEKIATLMGGAQIRSAQFSSDGGSLVAEHARGVRVWNLQSDPSNALWVELGGHSSNVHSVAFSPEGLYIALASDDGTIRICSAGRSQQVGQPRLAHDGVVTSMAVSPCGGFVVSGSADRSVRVWDMQTHGPRLAPLLGHRGIVRSVTISSDGRMIASASASIDYTVRLWNARTGEAVSNPLVGHMNDVRTVVFSPDMRCFASGSDDCTVRIWKTATRQSQVAPLCCTGWVLTVAFSPDSRLLAAGDSSGRIYLWHANSGQSVYEPLQANDDMVRTIAFSHNGAHIVAGGDDEKVYVWDIRTRQPLLILEGHIGWVYSVGASPSGKFICSGSVDKSVRVWSAATGAPIATLYGHMSPVISVAFTPDEQSVVSCSHNGILRVWDVNFAGSPFPTDPNDPVTALGTATFNDEWLVGPSGELLLWVPADYRDHLSVLSGTMPIVRDHTAVVIGTRGWIHGTDWVSCRRMHTLDVTPQTM